VELSHRFGTDVQRHPTCLNGFRRHHSNLLLGLHLLGADEVDRQDELLAPNLLDFPSIVKRRFLNQPFAGRVSLRFEESVRHRSTDE